MILSRLAKCDVVQDDFSWVCHWLVKPVSGACISDGCRQKTVLGNPSCDYTNACQLCSCFSLLFSPCGFGSFSIPSIFPFHTTLHGPASWGESLSFCLSAARRDGNCNVLPLAGCIITSHLHVAWAHMNSWWTQIARTSLPPAMRFLFRHSRPRSSVNWTNAQR